ncbi:MAG: retropepsin-like aspartic protease [Bryobacteraceae bacterium]
MRTAAALCVLLALPAAIAGEPLHADLKSFHEKRQWPELRQAIEHAKAPALYRAAALIALNEDTREAGKLLRSVIKSAPRSGAAYQAYEWLSHLYLRSGQYPRLISNMNEWRLAFPDAKDVKQGQAAMAGFRDLPDQTTRKAGPSTLRHESGSIFIPLSVNGLSAAYFFDTGAWVSCISESEAKRTGLSIHATAGTLGTATGARVGFRTAVAREVVVGKIRFQNVSFAVFPDDQEPGPRCHRGAVDYWACPFCSASARCAGLRMAQ